MPVRAQDTVQVLDEINVTSQRTPATLVTATPTQVLEAADIEAKGLLQLSDAVRQMAGVTLKDYGGVGGMKTVSARGLGSQFSTVTIDGIAVSDAQNGQVDLGRYLLGNAAYISFTQGQEQESLLSARAYAAGNVLNLETADPQFFLLERTNLRIGNELGSFGMISPSALWEQKWNRRLKSSLWINYLKSDGDYPFTLYYTATHADSSSRETRHHSAMRMFTADGNLFYSLGKDNTLSAKLHYMRGMHQLPGPVIYYTEVLSRQSTHEEAAFAQTKWRMLRKQWKLQVLGKIYSTYDLYEDSASMSSTTHYAMNYYRQRGGYLSGSAVWSPLKWFDLSMAADGELCHLTSNQNRRNDVQRSHLMAVLSGRVHHGPLEVRANLLATRVSDRVADLDTLPTYQRLSPYAAIRYTLFPGLTLRYFYKETYRTPNFSELYFFTADVPRNLLPEQAHQHNAGITYSRVLGTAGTLSATADAYINHVNNKIVARPVSNMFFWTMENLDRAVIMGIDATCHLQVSSVSMQLNYSLQHATDRTDPESKTYGCQIPYTPRHSGGGTLRWENRWVNVGATLMAVGARYSERQNAPDNRLPAYCDVGLSADREFDLRLGTLRVQMQVLNLLDIQYEVVRSYPMMGRNYRLNVTYIF